MKSGARPSEQVKIRRLRDQGMSEEEVSKIMKIELSVVKSFFKFDHKKHMKKQNKLKREAQERLEEKKVAAKLAADAIMQTE